MTGIAREIRDELDQSPEWWTRQYLKLLQSTFRRRPFNPAEHDGHAVVSVRTYAGSLVHEECTVCPPVWEPIPKENT